MIISYGGGADKFAAALSSFGFDVRPEGEAVADAFIYVSAKNCDLAGMVGRNSNIFLLNVATMSPEDAAIVLCRRFSPRGMGFYRFH